MSPQLQTALIRAVLGGLAAGAGATVLALSQGASLRAGLAAGLATVVVALGGRGLVEGSVDTGRAARGELVEKPPTTTR